MLHSQISRWNRPFHTAAGWHSGAHSNIRDQSWKSKLGPQALTQTSRHMPCSCKRTVFSLLLKQVRLSSGHPPSPWLLWPASCHLRTPVLSNRSRVARQGRVARSQIILIFQGHSLIKLHPVPTAKSPKINFWDTNTCARDNPPSFQRGFESRSCGSTESSGRSVVHWQAMASPTVPDLCPSFSSSDGFATSLQPVFPTDFAREMTALK